MMNISLFQFPITLTTPFFQEFLLEPDCFGTKHDKKVYINLRDSLGFTNEIEKPSWNDSKLTVTIELENAVAHKLRLRVWGYTNGDYLYMLAEGGLTRECTWSTYIKQGIWFLVGRKKQNGGCLPILASVFIDIVLSRYSKK